MSASVYVRRSGGWGMQGANGVRNSRGFGTGQTPAGLFSYPSGTGVNGVDTVYQSVSLSVPASSFVLVDLRGGGGERDMLNLSLSLSRVRWLYLELATPAASASLRFGPQNQTNAWQGPWSGVGATAYVTVPHVFDQTDGYNNWPVVDATRKVLAVYNPGGSAVVASLVVAGVA